jgi:hypothetical protein
MLSGCDAKLIFRVLQELLWVKRKFVLRIGFRRTRTQRSGTQCNGTRSISDIYPQRNSTVKLFYRTLYVPNAL